MFDYSNIVVMTATGGIDLDMYVPLHPYDAEELGNLFLPLGGAPGGSEGGLFDDLANFIKEHGNPMHGGGLEGPGYWASEWNEVLAPFDNNWSNNWFSNNPIAPRSRPPAQIQAPANLPVPGFWALNDPPLFPDNDGAGPDATPWSQTWARMWGSGDPGPRTGEDFHTSAYETQARRWRAATTVLGALGTAAVAFTPLRGHKSTDETADTAMSASADTGKTPTKAERIDSGEPSVKALIAGPYFESRDQSIREDV